MINKVNKDPAVLLYTNDFLSGTYTMTDEQVGKYIRLLCYQHQKGKLSEKDMQTICKGYDEDVYAKFEIIDGYYINQRMYLESERRSKFTESRRKNASAKHMDKHMENENENINENNTEIVIVTESEIKNENGDKDEKYPSKYNFIQYALNIGYTSKEIEDIWLYYQNTGWRDSKGKKVKSWKGKLLTLKKYRKEHRTGKLEQYEQWYNEIAGGITDRTIPFSETNSNPKGIGYENNTSGTN